MGQLDDVQVKGQNLTKMNLIVKRIEVELAQLKNLINEQIQSLPSANCDGNPDPDENPGDSSIIDDDSYCSMDILKIENDLIGTTAEEYDYDEGNNYQEEFNENQLNNQNRRSNVHEDEELILGGVNFEDQVNINQVVHSVDLKPYDVDLIQMSNENLEVAAKNAKIINTKLIVQMGVRCDEEILPKGSEKSSNICSICLKSFKQSSNLSSHMRIHTGERPFKCKICSKAFKRREHLKKHNLIHTGEKPYPCTICSRSFAYSHKRNDHILRKKGVRRDEQNPIKQSDRGIDQVTQNKNGNQQKDVKTKEILQKRFLKKSYICSTCSKSFIDSTHLSRHMKVHTGEKPFKCEICSKSFSLKEHLKTHNRVHTGEKPYSCSFCSKSFSHSQNRNDHILIIHKGEKPYSCSVCDQVFSTSSGVKKHQKRAHDGEKLTGVRCDKEILPKGSEKSSNICSICLKSFKKSTNLSRHMWVHTGERPFKCKICSKAFKRREHLNNHNLIHTGEKPYPCTICSRFFTYSHKRNDHILRIHKKGVRREQNPINLQSNRGIDQVTQNKNGNQQKDVKTKEILQKRFLKKSYICSTCSKSFRDSTNLSMHMMVHTGEKPFKCKICSKSFKRREHLKNHNRVHTGEKPYSCSICSKSFSLNQNRNDHILNIHKGEKPYSCSVCGKAFSTTGGFKKHQKRVHDGEKSTNVTDFQV